MTRSLYLDYNNIALQLDRLSINIKKESYDGIAIILRGGGFAGFHLSFLTGLPYFFLNYDRKTATVKFFGDAPIGKKILLCEDFAGKGETLINCQKFLTETGYHFSTLVICYDHLSRITPDYFCFHNTNSQVRFLLPWERHRINEAADFDMESGEQKADHDYEKTAWDLDGIFLNDIDPKKYVDDLENTLTLRDTYPRLDTAPKIKESDIILTGRPVSDQKRTLAWLKRNHINNSLVMRDDEVDQPNHAHVGRWKAKRCSELGFTHYVESELEQAVFMSVSFPELRIFWWNGGKPILLNATRVL